MRDIYDDDDDASTGLGAQGWLRVQRRDRRRGAFGEGRIVPVAAGLVLAGAVLLGLVRVRAGAPVESAVHVRGGRVAAAAQTPAAQSPRRGERPAAGHPARSSAAGSRAVALGIRPPPAEPRRLKLPVRPDIAPVAPPILPPVLASDLAVRERPVPVSERVRKPAAVRGIYLNAWAAASHRKRDRLIALADSTELNTFVIDVKDATGHVSYPSTIPLVHRIGADSQRRITDIRALLAELKRNHIYPIARIVCFKDPILAEARPDWAVRRPDGSLWHDQHGQIWVDAFDRNVWNYDIALAREALALGFSEVQWDYVRFPDAPTSYLDDAIFPARDGRSKEQAIREFLLYARRKLADMRAPITADVFGLTTAAHGDMGIGQNWPRMVNAVDVLLPMVYPSHYARGSYGINYPNGSPYEVVSRALDDAIRHSRGVTDAAHIRPWLQDFTLGPPAYGAPEVRAEIQAVYHAGLREWILWNPGSNYTASALEYRGRRAPSFPHPHFFLDSGRHGRHHDR